MTRIPLAANDIPAMSGYDSSTGTVNALATGPATTDSNGNTLATLKTDASATIQPISQPTSATGTPTSVAGSASAVALLASNGSRKAAYIYNDSSATLYVGFFSHTTLTTSNYTTQVPAENLFELPTSPVYTGEISGVWGSATGAARCTEMS